MLLVVGIVLCTGLLFVCWAAITEYRRILDSEHPLTSHEDGYSHNGAEVEAALALTLTKQDDPWDDDIARVQRRIAVRLDAIFERASVAPAVAPPPVPEPEIPVNLRPNQRALLRGTWAVAILAVIIGSLLPSDTLPIQLLNTLGINDKVLHLVAYALIAFLPAVHERTGFTLFAGLAFVTLGTALEYGQLYSPGRAFEGADIAADTLGVSFGILVGMPIKHWITLFHVEPEPAEEPAAKTPSFTRHELQIFQMH